MLETSPLITALTELADPPDWASVADAFMISNVYIIFVMYDAETAGPLVVQRPPEPGGVELFAVFSDTESLSDFVTVYDTGSNVREYTGKDFYDITVKLGIAKGVALNPHGPGHIIPADVLAAAAK